MNIREYMNNNPAVVTIGAVVILVICLGLIIKTLFKGSGGRTGPVDVYYYDLNTGELFTAGSDKFPPIQSPTDEGDKLSGVRAMVFSCGDCDKKSTHFVGYLERYTPEAKAAMERAASSDEPMMEDVYEMEQGREVKLPDAAEWIDGNSEAGMAVYEAIRQRCEADERPRQCFP